MDRRRLVMVSVLVLKSGSTWMLALAATTVMITVSSSSATLSLTIVIGLPKLGLVPGDGQRRGRDDVIIVPGCCAGDRQ